MLSCRKGATLAAINQATAIDGDEILPMDAARIASIETSSVGLVGVIVGVVLHARALGLFSIMLP